MVTVLVIEDNPANMKLSTLLLAHAGHEVVCATDAETESIPIVALSALAMKVDEERSRCAGCDAYIVKPLRYKELYRVMERPLWQPELPAERPAPPWSP